MQVGGHRTYSPLHGEQSRNRWFISPLAFGKNAIRTKATKARRSLYPKRRGLGLAYTNKNTHSFLTPTGTSPKFSLESTTTKPLQKKERLFRGALHCYLSDKRPTYFTIRIALLKPLRSTTSMYIPAGRSSTARRTSLAPFGFTVRITTP